MNARAVIVSLLLVIIALAAGFGAGWYIKPAPGVPLPAVLGTPAIVTTLSSKVVPSVAAYGMVTKISGKNVTLAYQGDSITVAIRDDAKVFSYVPDPAAPKTTTPGSRPIEFSQIKIADNLSVSLKVLPSGQLEGVSAIVLSSAPPATTTPAK